MSRYITGWDHKAWGASGAGGHRSWQSSSSSGSASKPGGTNPSAEATAPKEPVRCDHCESKQCCNSLWPFKDLAQETRSAGVLGPFTWCGLTVFVAVAESQHESLAITEYRREALSKRLADLSLSLDITVSEEHHSQATPRAKSPVKSIATSIVAEGRGLDVTQQNLAIGRAELITSAARQDATAGFNVSHEPGEIHIGKYIPDSSVGGTLVESTTRTTVSDISYDMLEDENSNSDRESRALNEHTSDCGIHSTGPGVRQCDCGGPHIIPHVKRSVAQRAPPEPAPPAPPADDEIYYVPANPAVAAEVTALLAQLQTLVKAQGSGNSLSEMFPKLAIVYQCEDVDDEEDEGMEMQLVMKFKAKKGSDGQHPMCVQARAALGAEGSCGGR